MSFQYIKGQPQAIRIIQEALRESRLSTSYLFLGPEGVGKNFTAKTLAKAVNCSADKTDACDKCPSCLKIDRASHPDIHITDQEIPEERIKAVVCEIELARENKDYFLEKRLTKELGEEGVTLENKQGKLSWQRKPGNPEIRIRAIRQLQKEISLKPYESLKSVFIIRNAHRMNEEASNAFLKILEEPPLNSLIILLSEKPNLLLKTIISRCKIIKFTAMDREELKVFLKTDCLVDERKAHFLAYFSEGCIGRALRLKETDILNQKNRLIDKFLLRETDSDNQPFKTREEMRSALNIMVSWFRDLYLLKIGMSNNEVINFDRKNELSKLCERYSWADLDNILSGISDALLYLRQDVNMKLLLSYLRHSITHVQIMIEKA